MTGSCKQILLHFCLQKLSESSQWAGLGAVKDLWGRPRGTGDFWRRKISLRETSVFSFVCEKKKSFPVRWEGRLAYQKHEPCFAANSAQWHKRFLIPPPPHPLHISILSVDRVEVGDGAWFTRDEKSLARRESSSGVLSLEGSTHHNILATIQVNVKLSKIKSGFYTDGESI